MSEKRVAGGVDGDESHSPSPGPPEVTITPDLSEDEGGEKNGADVVVEHESDDDEDSGSAADDKEQPKAKPKKPILVNIFLRCTSNDLVSEPDGLKTFLEKNDIGVKEVQASAEPSWVRLGQVELEQMEDRDKAVALCGQTLAGKELRVERARDSVNDRLYAPDDCILFVRNLAKSVTEEMLHTLFPKAKEVRLPRKNGKNRGFAFINFASKKEVDDLIRERQSEEHDGKTLKLGTYTSRDRSDRRNKGTPAKKSPSAKSQTSKSGKSGSKSGNRQQYGNYGAGRYQGRIQPLLDMDTSSFRNRGQYGFQDYDDYGFYNDFSQDFSLGSYLYDLHSRMGLESGLVKRMGMSRGFSGYDYGLDSNGLYGFGNLGYGQRMDGNRQGGFSGYRGLGGYSDGNNYRQSEKKRNKSGGNRTAKGKSGWPAK